MDFRDVVRSGLDEYLGDLEKAIDGLTPVELAWRPTPSSNNITWQVWHMATGRGPVGQLVPPAVDRGLDRRRLVLEVRPATR